MEKRSYRKVLLVDDEKPHRDLVRISLKGKSVTIRELSSGQGFHEVIKEFDPDLLLIDFQMPDKDGLTLCQELKEYNEKVHVILLSSDKNAKIEESLNQIGISDCWSKPITPAELRERLSCWVN
ncbi:MAG: response regulator [SAR324 cluster bacterium]|nr:response regulator [SAR324 cluster bacterium]